MSIYRAREITCPKCNTVGKFMVWESINVDENPEVKEKVKDKSLFKYICINCQEEYAIEYTTLYHDCTNRFMIWCLSNDSQNKDDVPEANNLLDNYKFRIVRNKNELREKILVLENKLNDMVVEALKVAVLENLPDNKKEKVKFIYFSSHNDEALIYEILFEDSHLNCSVSIDSYNRMVSDNKFLSPIGFKEINMHTVAQYLKNK